MFKLEGRDSSYYENALNKLVLNGTIKPFNRAKFIKSQKKIDLMIKNAKGE